MKKLSCKFVKNHMSKIKNIIILGSTGSIGTQTLDIIRQHPNEFNVLGLVAKSNWKFLDQQQKDFPKAKICLLNDPEVWQLLKNPKIDTVVNALSGPEGIMPTMSAIENKKNILIANKESFVSCGKLFLDAAKKNNVTILPIDSELIGILQCLQNGKIEEVEKIILTCSGGPFHRNKKSDLENVTQKQALNHPTWKMGTKITIDSSTLMNKGFELIAISTFFEIPEDKIEIIIHPQSIVHALIQWRDGNFTAALSATDMRFSIQYALFYPSRPKNNFPPLNLAGLNLSFQKPNGDIFTTLNLARDAAQKQGNMPAILSRINDEVVEKFLKGEIKFLEIFKQLQKNVSIHKYIRKPELKNIISLYANK